MPWGYPWLTVFITHSSCMALFQGCTADGLPFLDYQRTIFNILCNSSPNYDTASQGSGIVLLDRLQRLASEVAERLRHLKPDT